MELNQLIQLFKRHLLILIIVPIILAVTVYYFTRNQAKFYSSNVVIYTGIATGYSIESTDRVTIDYFSTNIQFDNLINLIYSNQTIEKTSIRLLAQDLCLEHYNQQYISRQNYKALQRIVPKFVKDLVVKNGKMGLERERDENIRNLQREIQGLENEISKKRISADRVFENNGQQDTYKSDNTSSGVDKTEKSVNEDTAEPGRIHTVQPGESIYSISSMYGISVGELIDLNNLPGNSVDIGQVLIISKGGSIKNQYHTVLPSETLFSISKKYGVSLNDLRRLNNLNTNSSLPVGMSLIISQTGKYNKNNNTEKEYSKSLSPDIELFEAKKESATSSERIMFSKDPIVPPGINLSDYNQTVNNFTSYYNSSDSNFIYELLHYVHKNYSLQEIKANCRVERISNSDFIKITFQSDDPGICQQTLKILTDVFIINYKQLRINQTSAVVEYFQRQVDSANARLQKAEDRLLRFNQKNNIINYYEQSKYIAAQKEDLDLYYQNEQIRLAAAAAALKELRTKLTAKDSIYLKSDEITKNMKKLSEISEKIAINEISNEYDPYIGDNLDRLKDQQKHIKNKIKLYVDQLYLYTHSNEGIPIKDILVEWLENSITYEEAKASLKVLSRRKLDFLKVYQIFAPLGAMLKRIEREISVAEQSFLELLHSLNQAKMKQQNLEMATNVKMVDEPFFPIQANPSKAKYLILIGGVIGFVIVAFIILILEYFDSTIKNPAHAVKLIKLKLAGVYPRIIPNSQSVDYNYIGNRLIEILAQNLKLFINHSSVYSFEKPYLILIFSTKNNTGKTTIANQLIKKLRSFGEKVLYLNYSLEKDQTVDEDFNYAITYNIDNRFVEIKNIQELLISKYIRKDNYKYDYIFLEIPSIILNSYPLELINSVDVALLVVKATDHWKNADIAALNTIIEVAREKPLLVLNDVELFALEDIIDEIPIQKRKSLRRKIKKIVTYPFKLRIRFRVDKR